jgi:filamentous hemagglutinin
VEEGVRGVTDDPPLVEWVVSGTIDRKKKLDGYLLSPHHPLGKHKARLWDSVFGFDQSDSEFLESAIRTQLNQAKPMERLGRPVRKWELVIPRFRGPNGNEGPVLTAWALPPDKDRPHLTTAYPIVGT